MKIQEEFNQTAYDTIEKLDKYICSCDSIIQILGEGAGEMADPVAIEAYLAREPGFVDSMKQHGDFRTLPLSYTMWEAFLAAYRGRNLFVYRASAPIRNGQPTKADGFDKDWPVFVSGLNDRALLDQHCERLKNFRPRRYPTTFGSLDELNRLFLRGMQEILAATAPCHQLQPQWLIIPDRQWTGTPGALLRADHAIVPFHGREKELAAWKVTQAEGQKGLKIPVFPVILAFRNGKAIAGIDMHF